MKRHVISGLFCFFLFAVMCIRAYGQEENTPVTHEPVEKSKKGFEASTFIMDHIADSHEWHLFTVEDKENPGHEKHISLYLPVILISREKGIDIFSSKKLAHGHVHKGYKIAEEGDLKGKIINVDEKEQIIEGSRPIDLSMTKAVIGMMVAALIGLLIFISLSRSYRKTGISHPQGIQGFLEPAVLFIRDDIAIPNIGHRYEKYMPYLLSVFFFILINNLMGLIPFPPPFGANVTGNVGITFVLAACTFLITQFSGNKSYWKHIFAAPGVPVWLLPIMIPVELIGIVSKPFALMIRLFANITAGHIIVLSLICLIFIFDTLWVSPVSIIFVIFMDCIELLVAFLQAYIFTLLSSLFIGMAVAEEHH